MKGAACSMFSLLAASMILTLQRYEEYLILPNIFVIIFIKCAFFL